MADDKKADAAAEVAAEEEKGLMVKVIEHVMQPGSSLTQRMQYIINGIFAALFLSIGFLIAVDPEGSIHPKVMLGLFLGLAVSTNWFFSIILSPEFIEEQKRAEEEAAEKAKEAEEEEGEEEESKKDSVLTMGLPFGRPQTTKVVQRHNTPLFHVGVSSIDGYRETMEDVHAIVTPTDVPWGFFGVFDGHRGVKCASYTSSKLEESVRSVGPVADEVLTDQILEIDREYLRLGHEGGTTATFMIANRNTDGTYHLQVGNVGDSRVILGRRVARQADPLTQDHKPTDVREHARIVRAGGFVQLGRVDGTLAVSRALGDRSFKNGDAFNSKVIAVPDFTHCTAAEGDFVLLCCDGVFESDVFTTTSVMDFIFGKLDRAWDLGNIASAICDEAIHRGSYDNISAMIVQLGSTPDCSQSMWMARREVFRSNGCCT